MYLLEHMRDHYFNGFEFYTLKVQRRVTKNVSVLQEFELIRKVERRGLTKLERKRNRGDFIEAYRTTT